MTVSVFDRNDPRILRLQTGGCALDTEHGRITVHGAPRCPDGPECPEHGQVVRIELTTVVGGNLSILPWSILGELSLSFDEGGSRAFGVKGRRRSVILPVYRGEFARATRWYAAVLDALNRAGVDLQPYQS